MKTSYIYSTFNMFGAVAAVLLVLIGFAGRNATADSAFQVATYPTPTPPWEEIACIQDVMQCPDGSFVGRDPKNNCEFYPCSSKKGTPQPVPIYSSMPATGGLQASPEAVRNGKQVEVVYGGSRDSYVFDDWIGMYIAGDARNENYVGWSRLSGNMATFTAGSAGSYVFRFFPNNGYESSVESNSVTITPALSGENSADDALGVGIQCSENVMPGWGCPSPTPSPTPTPTIPPSPEPTPTLTPSPAPPETPTPTPSPSPTETPTVSPEPSPSLTATPSPSPAVTIVRIEPSAAPPLRLVKIFGSGFTTFNSVILAGEKGTFSATGVSATGSTLVFFVPSIPSGAYDVSVSNERGTSNSLPFIVGETVQYTALGDSIARGLSAILGYVRRYEFFIERDNNIAVNTVNLAVSGWQSGELRNALKNDPNMRSAVQNAKLVTFNIGGNDLRVARNRYKAGTCGGKDNQDCLRATENAFRFNWVLIVAELKVLTLGKDIVIRTMDLYNPFVDVDKSTDTWPKDGGLNDFQVLKQYIDRVNSQIASSGFKYARVYKSFNGPNGDQQPTGLISQDGFHPNDAGHARIANLLRELGYNPF